MTRNRVTESRQNPAGTQLFMLALKFLARGPSLVVTIHCYDEIAENIYQRSQYHAFPLETCGYVIICPRSLGEGGWSRMTQQTQLELTVLDPPGIARAIRYSQ